MVFKKGNQYGKLSKGNPAWNKGLTKETDDRVKKYGKTLKGRKFTTEHIKNLKEAQKNNIRNRCNKCGRIISISNNHKCPEISAIKGRKIPAISKRMKISNPMFRKESREKMINTLKRKYKNGEIKLHTGKLSHFWKGGISFEPYSVDWTKTLKRSIRERDKYQCQLCHKQQEDEILHVHHIDYNKKNCNPNNLISLCKSCHMKTNTNREKWRTILGK